MILTSKSGVGMGVNHMEELWPNVHLEGLMRA